MYDRMTEFKGKLIFLNDKATIPPLFLVAFLFSFLKGRLKITGKVEVVHIVKIQTLFKLGSDKF